MTRAVHVVFGEWTALKMAVEQEWAGSGTRDRALGLLNRVRDGLLASSTVYRDEIEDMLDNALIDDFNIEAEDESPAQLAVLLCTMHEEAKAGTSPTADALLARAAGRRTWVEVPPPPRARGDDDSSDDDCDEDEDGSGAGSSAAPMQEYVRPEPEVDEDGFQTVAPRRGRGKPQGRGGSGDGGSGSGGGGSDCNEGAPMMSD